MRRVVTILAVVGATLVAVGGLFWMAQRKLIYFPTQAVSDVRAVSPDSEAVVFTTDDGLMLTAWWIPAWIRQMSPSTRWAKAAFYISPTPANR